MSNETLSGRYNNNALLQWLTEPTEGNQRVFARQLILQTVLANNQIHDADTSGRLARTWQLDYQTASGSQYKVTAAFKAMEGEANPVAGWELIVQKGDKRLMTAFDSLEGNRSTFTVTVGNNVSLTQLEPLQTETAQNMPFFTQKAARIIAASKPA